MNDRLSGIVGKWERLRQLPSIHQALMEGTGVRRTEEIDCLDETHLLRLERCLDYFLACQDGGRAISLSVR